MTGVSFGVVSAPGPAAGAGWLDRVREFEAQGFGAVLTPDTLFTLSPLPALAAAAAVTSTLRLRSWVLAAPLRAPAALAREAAAVQALSGGRFELGIGSGRPDVEREAARLGVRWGTAADRMAQVAAAAAAVRGSLDPVPPVVVAAGGPKMLALAAELADRVAIALPPTATVADLETATARVREAAGRPLPLSFAVVGVGERLPAFLARRFSAADLGDAAGLVPADPGALADHLHGWHERYGIDEVVVPEELADAIRPLLH